MKETITCCYIGYGMRPLAIEVPKDDALRSFQEWVQGDVDVRAVRSDGILFWVNEDGLVNNMPPNMVIYANKGMEEAGFLSQVSSGSVVRDGDLYDVLCGPIVAARSDDEGNLVDLHPEDIARLQQERPDSTRAVEETNRIRKHLPPLGRDGVSRPAAFGHRFWPDDLDLMPTEYVVARDVPSTTETFAALDKAATKNAGSVPQTHEKIDTNHGRSL